MVEREPQALQNCSCKCFALEDQSVARTRVTASCCQEDARTRVEVACREQQHAHIRRVPLSAEAKLGFQVSIFAHLRCEQVLLEGFGDNNG